MAGVPVYSTQGRNGGWRLVGGARTDLSGLNAPGGPGAVPRGRARVGHARGAGGAAQAGPGAARAVPLRRRGRVDGGGRRSRRGGAARTTTDRRLRYLEVLQPAVIEGGQVRLGYVARDRSASERVVHPLGLAAKGSAWYLVADTRPGCAPSGSTGSRRSS